MKLTRGTEWGPMGDPQLTVSLALAPKHRKDLGLGGERTD